MNERATASCGCHEIVYFACGHWILLDPGEPVPECWRCKPPAEPEPAAGEAAALADEIHNYMRASPYTLRANEDDAAAILWRALPYVERAARREGSDA